MIYAYIRVSTDDQSVENQRSMIIKAGYVIDTWLSDEGVSGTVAWQKRDIKKAVNRSVASDMIVVAELSRLGRSLKQILEIVEICRKKSVTLVLIREGLKLDDDSPFSKLLVSILGSLAEMERNLISQRTKDALARKKLEGIILGRPIGKRTDPTKRIARKKAPAVQVLLDAGLSKSATAHQMKIHRGTIDNWMKEGLLVWQHTPDLMEGISHE